MKIKSARGRYSRNREQHVWKLRGMGIRHRHKKIKWRSTKNPSCLSSFDPSFVGQRKSRDNGIWCIESTVITSGHCSRSVGFLNRQSGQGPQATACESDARLQRTMYLTTGLRMARRGVPKAVTFELRPEEDEDPRRVPESWGRETAFHGQSMGQEDTRWTRAQQWPAVPCWQEATRRARGGHGPPGTAASPVLTFTVK